MPPRRLAYLDRLFRPLWGFLAGYVEVVSITTFGFYFLEDGSPNILNPPSTSQFAPGDAILSIGAPDNPHKRHRWLGVGQGR
jgi:hypothetical protein